MANRVCPECGHLEGEYTYFCTECGAKTVESSGAGQLQQPFNSANIEQTQRTGALENNNVPQPQVNAGQAKEQKRDPVGQGSVASSRAPGGSNHLSQNNPPKEKNESNKRKNKFLPLIVTFGGCLAALLFIVIIFALSKNNRIREVEFSEGTYEAASTDTGQQVRDNSASGTTASGNRSNSDMKKTTAEEVKQTEATDATEATEETIEDTEAAEEGVDVEDQVVDIREQYNNIVRNMADGVYREKVDGNGMRACYEGDLVRAIIVPRNADGNDYAKYFYFDNDQMVIFAYYEAEDANRLYFSEGNLIRWRYSPNAPNAQEAVNHDLERDNPDYLSWEDRSFWDAYDYLMMFLNMEEDVDYILPGSDSRYLDIEELSGLSPEECRLARNELYARHGRRFDDEVLQAYFDSKEWYEGTVSPSDFTEDILNDYEMYNRDLIVQFEMDQGYR